MSESTNKSYREFWIDDILNVSRPYQRTAYLHFDDTDGFRGKTIHVIEIAALDDLKKSYDDLKKQLSVDYQYQEIERLKNELEKERMRLVACGVVALANTKESAKLARKMHDDYWCASVRDVANMVDREINLREALKVAEDALDFYENIYVNNWALDFDELKTVVLEAKAEIKKIKES